ncbi:MAG: hypothetical protein IEMM0002_0465 [bacterium]|nr:MAG: hypothetical protein IEMM0002_0465 [bacterium]
MIHGVSDRVSKMVQSIVSAQGTAVRGNRTAAAGAGTAKPAVQSSSQSVSVDPAALEAAVNSINKEAGNMNVRLSLSIDKDLNRVLIRFTDPESGDVIRQIPPEAVLSMLKRLNELKGAMFDSQG